MQFHLLSPEEMKFESDLSFNPFFGPSRLRNDILQTPERGQPSTAPLKNHELLPVLENKKASRQREFFRKFAPYAVQTQQMYGIPASVTLAQAALESGWGKHAPGNNFFGIKGMGPAGFQLLRTREYRNGESQQVLAKFRRYDDPLQSFQDHARVIHQSRYLRHALQHNDSAEGFITALQSGKRKYATDPEYTRKIMGIIHRYGLKKYDRKGLTGSNNLF